MRIKKIIYLYNINSVDKTSDSLPPMIRYQLVDCIMTVLIVVRLIY